MGIAEAILIVIALVVFVWDFEHAKSARDKGDIKAYVRFFLNDTWGKGFIVGLLVAYIVLWIV